MFRNRLAGPIATLALLIAVPAWARAPGDEGPRPSPARLVGLDDLQKRLGDTKLRLLDARPRADYDRGHLPGAVWVDVKAAATLAGRPGGLDDREGWEKWLAPLAIGPNMEVLVYDDKRQLDAARLWWLLGYLGVDRVGLIDGGFSLWKEQGRPVTTDLPEVEPRAFAVAFRKDRHADRAGVVAALKGATARVLDARSDAEYTGEKALSGRGGHIPSACHLEWSQFVDAKGRFLADSAIQEKLKAAGIRPGEPVISHCQGGGRASVAAFAAERGGSPARNYYLGWSDWGNAKEAPIATGDEPGGAEGR